MPDVVPVLFLLPPVAPIKPDSGRFGEVNICLFLRLYVRISKYVKCRHIFMGLLDAGVVQDGDLDLNIMIDE